MTNYPSITDPESEPLNPATREAYAPCQSTQIKARFHYFYKVTQRVGYPLVHTPLRIE
jgi:hypothetical protein